MKIMLNESEYEILSANGVNVVPEKDYTDTDALAIVDDVVDLEVQSVEDGNESEAKMFADIADKIQNQVPENDI